MELPDKKQLYDRKEWKLAEVTWARERWTFPSMAGFLIACQVRRARMRSRLRAELRSGSDGATSMPWSCITLLEPLRGVTGSV
jgi:hypothetical protein